MLTVASYKVLNSITQDDAQGALTFSIFLQGMWDYV